MEVPSVRDIVQRIRENKDLGEYYKWERCLPPGKQARILVEVWEVDRDRVFRELAELLFTYNRLYWVIEELFEKGAYKHKEFWNLLRIYSAALSAAEDGMYIIEKERIMTILNKGVEYSGDPNTLLEIALDLGPEYVPDNVMEWLWKYFEKDVDRAVDIYTHWYPKGRIKHIWEAIGAIRWHSEHPESVIRKFLPHPHAIALLNLLRDKDTFYFVIENEENTFLKYALSHPEDPFLPEKIRDMHLRRVVGNITTDNGLLKKLREIFGGYCNLCLIPLALYIQKTGNTSILHNFWNTKLVGYEWAKSIIGLRGDGFYVPNHIVEYAFLLYKLMGSFDQFKHAMEGPYIVISDGKPFPYSNTYHALIPVEKGVFRLEPPSCFVHPSLVSFLRATNFKLAKDGGVLTWKDLV